MLTDSLIYFIDKTMHWIIYITNRGVPMSLQMPHFEKVNHKLSEIECFLNFICLNNQNGTASQSDIKMNRSIKDTTRYPTI